LAPLAIGASPRSSVHFTPGAEEREVTNCFTESRRQGEKADPAIDHGPGLGEAAPRECGSGAAHNCDSDRTPGVRSRVALGQEASATSPNKVATFPLITEALMTTALAKRDEVSPLLRIFIPGLAEWLGWGIRGQIGHETGAMIPGALVGLSLAVTASDPEIRRRAGLLGATGAMGTSFGGTETYGQTLGLTMGETRDQTYWWGMLGIAIKGGAWIGLSGAYLGMAASDKDYTPLELLWLTGAMTALWHLGVETINRPHEPPDNLPRWYFSGGAGQGRPRPEIWAGQWFALLGLLSYVSLVKRDQRATIMTAFGILGGAAGFSGAQAIQAWARGKGLVKGDGLYRYLDWWKVMETTYGLIAGSYLGAGMMVAEAAGDRLPPRKDLSLVQTTMGRAAGGYALLSHLQDRPWTEQAMDSMVIGNVAIANAFACDVSAWMEALPLVHTYTMKNTLEYYEKEAGLEAAAPSVRCWSSIAGIALSVLSPVLAQAQRSGSRWAAAVGLLLAAWGQTTQSHVKMLLDRKMLEPGEGEGEAKALPPCEMVKRVVKGSKERLPGQYGTETAFTVAALLLTGLVAYVLRKRRD